MTLVVEQVDDGIMANELRAAIYAVEAYLPELRGATVRFMEDNQAVMFSVNKWSSRNPLLHKLLRRFSAAVAAEALRRRRASTIRHPDLPGTADA